MRRLRTSYLEAVRRSKQGGAQDLIYIMVILLVFGAILLISGKFMDELNTNLANTGILDARGETAVSQINNLYPTALDNGFLYLMIGLCIVALVLAMLVAVHPVFFIFYIILLTIIIFMGGVLSNIYQEMALNSELADIAAKLTYTSHILEYLPIIIGVVGFILAIVMYRTYQNAI